MDFPFCVHVTNRHTKLGHLSLQLQPCPIVSEPEAKGAVTLPWKLVSLMHTARMVVSHLLEAWLCHTPAVCLFVYHSSSLFLLSLSVLGMEKSLIRESIVETGLGVSLWGQWSFNGE